MSGNRLDRRVLIKGMAAASTTLLAGCDDISNDPTVRRVLESAETLTRTTQQAILTPDDLAREYPESELSKDFKANGSVDPQDPEYVTLAANGFADWTLAVDGLVDQPLSLSLGDLRAMPSRTQITRHDCVEGWSSIGKWKGVPLSAVLDRAGLKSSARYIVFHCADTLGRGARDKYYESIDLADAYHIQTILAYEMNDQTLPVPHGAPLRLRVERQLGYKMAKYIMRIEATDSFESIGGGKGGFWEDRGYAWYAGI